MVDRAMALAWASAPLKEQKDHCLHYEFCNWDHCNRDQTTEYPPSHHLQTYVENWPPECAHLEVSTWVRKKHFLCEGMYTTALQLESPLHMWVHSQRETPCLNEYSSGALDQPPFSP